MPRIKSKMFTEMIQKLNKRDGKPLHHRVKLINPLYTVSIETISGKFAVQQLEIQEAAIVKQQNSDKFHKQIHSIRAFK